MGALALHRFLIVPFDDAKITLARLLAFTIDSLARMIANNGGGELTARIAATTSALNLVQDSASDNNTKQAIQSARVQAKDAFRTSLSQNIAKIHGGVLAHFGPDAPELTECFPEGRGVYGTCHDDELEMHLDTLVSGLGVYQAALGAGLGTQATTLRTTWLALFAASGSAKGAVSQTREAQQEARENLQLMLFLNLLKIAELFPRQEDELDTFMNQSLLEVPQSQDDETPTPPTPTPPTP